MLSSKELREHLSSAIEQDRTLLKNLSDPASREQRKQLAQREGFSTLEDYIDCVRSGLAASEEALRTLK